MCSSDLPAGAGTEQADDGEEQPAARAAPARPADAPIYTAAVPADAEAQLKAIDDWKRGELGKVNAERAALLKQFNDGDLDADAFSAADAKLLDRRDEIGEEATRRREPIVLAVNRAQVAAEMTQQQMLNAWKATFTSFFAEQKSAGFDYRAEANKDALAFFDARVKALADAYEDTPEGWKDLLADAHALTARKFGIPEPKPAKAAEAKPDSKPEPKARTSRQPDLSKVPPTIGRAPAAANPNVSGNEFAHLDGLDGVALEKAVMKMSKEQQERWANA